jgi:uncharacterized membrane protein
MNDLPATTPYHRWLGWHAPAMRRAVVVLLAGFAVVLALLPFVEWELAVITGWDVASAVFLGTVWPMILRAGAPRTAVLASREDDGHASAAALLIGASVASLLGVGFALGLANDRSGPRQAALVAVAALTVALSWTVMNTVYTLRYTHLDYRDGTRIDFGDPDPHAADRGPSYRDYAYLAFTVGMTYQVSDTTLRDPRIRGTVLRHATLSYVFGVVIVAGAVNLISGLVT